jgi:hypothetical protein
LLTVTSRLRVERGGIVSQSDRVLDAGGDLVDQPGRFGDRLEGAACQHDQRRRSQLSPTSTPAPAPTFEATGVENGGVDNDLGLLARVQPIVDAHRMRGLMK